MKTIDIEIFTETALLNVKRETWTVEKGKFFIIEKINELFKDLNDRLEGVLNDK